MRHLLLFGLTGVLALATTGISSAGPPGGNGPRSPCEPWLRPAGTASVGRVAPGSQPAADLGRQTANGPGPLLTGRFLDDDWCWTKPRIPRPRPGPSGPLSSPETIGLGSKIPVEGPRQRGYR